MNAYFAMLDDAEAYSDVYGQLMLHAAGFANDDLFARMLSSQASGAGALRGFAAGRAGLALPICRRVVMTEG